MDVTVNLTIIDAGQTYAHHADSTPIAVGDKITDFRDSGDDRVDLSAIDAISGGANDTFTNELETFR